MPQDSSPQESDLIPSASLKSQKSYTCADHPNRCAYCLCAKCGKFICEKCAFWVSGRRYCETCIEQDDALLEALRRDLFTPVTTKPVIPVQIPTKISHLPNAIKQVFTNTTAFFAVAPSSNFGLTLIIAVVAIAPINILQFTVFQDTALASLNYPKWAIEIISSMPIYSLIAAALLHTAIRIFALDFIFFVCIRIFTGCTFNYAQSGTLLHYCLLPLILVALGTAVSMPFFNYLGIIIMLVLLLSATRASTKCGFFQELGVALTFMISTTLFGLLY